MSEPRRHAIEVAGVRWHVREYGSGPPVLAVHGTGSTGDSFESLAAHLPAHTIVAPDLPGHGRTPLDRDAGPALPAFAEGLAEVLDQLGHAPRVAIGHSAGAAVVGWMALEGLLEPALCVGLGAALVPFEPTRQAFASFGARLLARSGIGRGLARLAPAVERFAAPTEGLPPERVERYRRLAADPSHVEGVLGMLARWNVAPLYERLGSVPGRWVLLGGTDDSVVPPHHQRLAASRLLHARVAVLSGGHLFHETHPAMIASEITGEMRDLHLVV